MQELEDSKNSIVKALKKINIIADIDIPYLKGIFEPYADIQYMKGSKIQKSNLNDADCLITRTRTKCNVELLAGTNVKFIATATIGSDHIDIEYCAKNGISWQNAPGCNSGSVMQYIASALVNLSLKYNFDLTEKNIGIIGHGNVGSKVSRLAKTLGMKVMVNDPPLQRQGVPGDYFSIEEIKKNADIISFHVPLNRNGIDKTFRMVDENFFNGLKDEVFIINSSRGEVIENNALKKALISKRISGTVIDVWENEPDIDLELLKLIDFATPHIAGYSVDGKANGTSMSVNGISKFFNLGIENWYPADVPKPKNNIIRLDNKLSERDNVEKLILSTYDIADDNQRLKSDVSKFEELRATYPARREFGAYEVQIESATEEFENKIKELGFQIYEYK